MRKKNFNLTPSVGDIAAERLTSSFVNESEIHGRGKEKEELVNILLSNADDLSIYSVWGMGGLELDPLQQYLQKKLAGKKFLLVLDDVWDACGDWWSKLKEVLRCGATGSAVIVTTRMEKVAHKMATAFVHHISGLSEEDSWDLFQRLAFEKRTAEERAHLGDIGVSIVKKCGGVPLALKALGNLMQLKKTEDQWIAVKEKCLLIEGNIEFEIPETVRHMGAHGTLSYAPEDKDIKSRSLRSILLSRESYRRPVSDDALLLCFTQQKHLRALSMGTSLASTTETLPKSICDLKHLRYLDVSSSFIKKLPEGITSLQNLQTLNLRNCHCLTQLPEGMKQMKSLVYLDIDDCCALRFMPLGMGQLMCLRKLPVFIVGKEEGRGIGELERLNNLAGELSIKDLDNVKNLSDARRANLKSKTALLSLTLFWHGDGRPNSITSIPNNEEEVVLGALQPHSNLKKLRLIGYRGSKFPNWMMNLNSTLPNLVEMELSECHHCEQLPPFGKLQFLKSLVFGKLQFHTK
ncbi:hypothetical protein OIU77_001319 [Salix suchowensis]|uniref:NB-ARC domain-containing protein n=1 Tax=Salix suchowensis TaxID=1278906 RepID=A0ABQ9B311_9ROSI|nr:hypothetical protein OIU77_001319 [Salix suchowensis]